MDGNHLPFVSDIGSLLHVMALDWISEILTFLQNRYQIDDQELSSVLNPAQEHSQPMNASPSLKFGH